LKEKKMEKENIIIKIMIKSSMMEIGKVTENKEKVIFNQNKALMMDFG
jgi:hypothetical protein